jgi:hypothetical protein
MPAQGSRAQMALAFESTYGVAPASGYFRVPFASTTLATTQPLLENELVGMGRDPLAPQRDAVTSGGAVVVPVDVRNIGYWLKGLMGHPTTTGTTNRVHTFTSGGQTLPSMAIEKGNPDVPAFEMFTGCYVDSMQFNFERSGLLQSTAQLIAQGSNAPATTTAAGTPTEAVVSRFGHFNGSILRNSAALGNIVSAELTYANNMDRIETIRADGRIDGADPGGITISGSLTSRFADTTLLTQAINGASCTLDLGWTIDVNTSLILTLHEVYLPRPTMEIPGPGGIQVTFDFMAARAVSPARAMTAVLRNNVTGY